MGLGKSGWVHAQFGAVRTLAPVPETSSSPPPGPSIKLRNISTGGRSQGNSSCAVERFEDLAQGINVHRGPTLLLLPISGLSIIITLSILRIQRNICK